MGRIAGVSSDETKERLLEAAATTFASQGYEGAKVSTIARRAGVTTGAIYSHYEDKSKLMCEAIREHGKKAISELLEETPQTSIIEFLKRAGYELPFKSSEDGALLLEATVASRRDVVLKEALGCDVKSQQVLIKKLLDGAKESGEMEDSLPSDAVAHLSLMIGLGSIVTRTLGIETPDRESWIQIIDRLVGSLKEEKK